MTITSRASCKSVDVENFQVLEESAYSEVTIFPFEVEEDGNEPVSDEDGQLDDNSVTRKTGKDNEDIEIACPQAVINYTKHGRCGCK